MNIMLYHINIPCKFFQHRTVLFSDFAFTSEKAIEYLAYSKNNCTKEWSKS